MSENNLLYSWEFNGQKDRSYLWYSIAISAIVGLIAWGFLTKQYGMSFVILLLSGIFYYLENNSDDIITVSITHLGIQVNKNFYDYGNIDSFTLIYGGNQAVYLRLNMIKKGIRHIDLHIDNEIAENIKNTLPNFLNENAKQDLSFSDKLIHIMKL